MDGYSQALTGQLHAAFTQVEEQYESFAGQTGGPKVVTTTSSLFPEVARKYQHIYTNYGARGSRLVVVPFNQASTQDVTALIEYIYSSRNGFGWDLDFLHRLEIHTTIRACTLGNEESKVNFLASSGYVAPDALGETNFGPSSPQKRDGSVPTTNAAACGQGAAIASSATVSRTQHETTSDPLSSKAFEDAILAVEALRRSLKHETASCREKKIVFAYLHGTLVLLVTTLEEEDLASVSSRRTLEICAGHCTASHIFGVADSSGDFNAVQSIMKFWNDGKLLSAPARSEKGGDTCPSLATRYGIGLRALESFNQGTPDFCNRIQPGQSVCCSSGTLPVVGPGPNPDGSCRYHEVQQDEICQTIAACYGVTTADLFDFNKETWGWNGCAFRVGLRICVSVGFPPLPASVWNADCGPMVPGTEPPKEGEELAEMNPCRRRDPSEQISCQVRGPQRQIRGSSQFDGGLCVQLQDPVGLV
ncbi:hypothetical protein BDW60DRAFT_207372 [Aspergillus nidulans var. acristatus]